MSLFTTCELEHWLLLAGSPDTYCVNYCLECVAFATAALIRRLHLHAARCSRLLFSLLLHRQGTQGLHSLTETAAAAIAATPCAAALLAVHYLLYAKTLSHKGVLANRPRLSALLQRHDSKNGSDRVCVGSAAAIT
jgi:hypothetical protein